MMMIPVWQPKICHFKGDLWHAPPHPTTATNTCTNPSSTSNQASSQRLMFPPSRGHRGVVIIFERLNTSIHIKPHFSDLIKLPWPQPVLNSSSARHTIVGLSGIGNNYSEAIAMLQECYDRPCLLNQSHLLAIVEVPLLKDRNVNRLLRLHNCCIRQQWVPN